MIFIGEVTGFGSCKRTVDLSTKHFKPVSNQFEICFVFVQCRLFGYRGFTLMALITGGSLPLITGGSPLRDLPLGPLIAGVPHSD